TAAAVSPERNTSCPRRTTMPGAYGMTTSGRVAWWTTEMDRDIGTSGEHVASYHARRAATAMPRQFSRFARQQFPLAAAAAPELAANLRNSARCLTAPELLVA